jgi:PAS domain S-box-containing protein
MVRQPNEPADPLERSVEAWQESEEYYRTLFTLAPDVIYSVSAEDGVFTALSPEFENITGWSVDEWLGRSFAGIIHPDDLPTAVEKFQAGLRGESPPPYELRIRSKSGAYLVGEFRTKPKIQDGKVVGKIGIARDITERKRAENALRFLAEASSLLASSLDYQTTLVNVARLAVPQIADWCIVDIVEESGSLHQLAVAHVDPSKEEMARELRRRYPPDERSTRGVREAIRTGQSMLVPEISDAQLAATARDPEHLAILRDLGFRSAMIVPLVARGRTLGAITLVSAESEHRYGADDLAMAEDLARDATLAVDNARLFEDAQEALRLREEFLSIASHELKTPLTA